AAGLTQVPAAAFDRLLRYLDKCGICYGIEIGDRPSVDLIGYVIKPAQYRRIEVSGDEPVHFTNIQGLSSALYATVPEGADPDDGLLMGDATIDNSSASVTLSSDTPGDSVLLLYPQRQCGADSPEAHLTDLWEGYDDYRDRLLAYFSHVHLGPGFRFFLDPLGDEVGENGDEPNLIPTSDGFRLAFQAWLQKRYAVCDDLNQAWGVKNRDILTYGAAACCIPLWFSGRGYTILYDPVKRHQYPVLNEGNVPDHFWKDLYEFKRQSIRGYMNAIAVVLKTAVANVPVLYQTTKFDPLMVNDSSKGYDGVAVVASRSDDRGRFTSTGEGLAEVEGSARAGWLIASDADAAGAPTAKSALFIDWNQIVDAGARGVFTPLPDPPVLSAHLASNTDADPLAWIASFRSSMDPGMTDMLRRTQTVLWYPAGALLENPGVRRLGDGAMWLPTDRPARLVALGDHLRAYVISDSANPASPFVLWSPDNALSQVHLVFGKDSNPVITDPLGNVLSVKKRDGTWTVPVSGTPTLIGRVPDLPIPIEMLDATTNDALGLLKLADTEKVNVEYLRQQLFYTSNAIMDTPATVEVKLARVQNVVASLKNILQPYVWIEGESSSDTSFDSIAAAPFASGGAYLELNNASAPPVLEDGFQSAYSAVYMFTVSQSGRYTVWMAGSRLDSPDTSPFSYVIDDGAPQTTGGIYPTGQPYGIFYWSDLGDIEVNSGTHKLTILVTDHRPSDGRYALSIDAFCLSRVPFHPDGANPPRLDVPIPAASAPVPTNGKRTGSGETVAAPEPDTQE
ncbi:MAG: hypothetical protein ACLQVD_16920, partial [Capsulimonadaceae bacterium]